MPVLHDFGEAAYQRAVQQATDLANRLGIQPEVIIQFVNDTKHFPTSIAELERWGDTPDKVYGVRRRSPSGVWTPLMPGPTPGTLGERDPGFRHVINNSVDKLERFLDVDPSGNIWGGSWDPAVNAQHPEWAGRSGIDTAFSLADAGSGSGGAGSGPGVGDYLSGSVPGGAGGINDIIQAALYGNQRDFDLRENAQQFGQQATRDARYDALRQAELARYDRNRQFDLSRYDQNRQYDLGRYDARRLSQEGRLDSRFGQQLQNQQYQQGRFDTQRANDRSLYSQLAQALLGSAVELGSRPRDWVKYNQMLSGGRDITQQLFGDQPRADFSGFTGGEPEAGRVTDILSALGLPQLPGGSVGQGSADAEREWLARQGVRALGDQDFFGAGADAREAQWMGSRVGAEPRFGPEPYTPPPDLPMMPSVTDYREAARGAADRLIGGFGGLLQRHGVSGMGADDPRLIAYYQAETGLSAPAARFAAEKAAEYYKTTGKVIPSSILAGWINEAKNQDYNTDPSRNQARLTARGYDDAARRLGYYPGSDHPETLRQYRDVAGLDPASAIDAARRMHAYSGAVGRAPTADELMRHIEEARSRGATPRWTSPSLGGGARSRGFYDPSGAALPDPDQYLTPGGAPRRPRQFAFA